MKRIILLAALIGISACDFVKSDKALAENADWKCTRMKNDWCRCVRNSGHSGYAFAAPCAALDDNCETVK